MDVKKLCGVGSSQVAELNENEKKKKTQRNCSFVEKLKYICIAMYIVCKVLFLRTSASISEALVQYTQDKLRIRLRNVNEI